MLKEPNEITKSEQDIFITKVSRVYTALPITKKDLFAGRRKQLAEALEAIFNPGQHVIIFGEPGVGKTSLASVVDDFAKLEPAQQDILVTKVDCSSADTFDSVWRKIFDGITVLPEGEEDETKRVTITKKIGKTEITPYVVQRELSSISTTTLVVLIFDEFNIIQDPTVRLLFAETIKTLSNNAMSSTLFLVGVADNVDQLLERHQLAGRNLIEIHMPRMSPDEAKQILIDNGLEKIGMGIEDQAVERIIRMAQGLPNYVHALGKHSAILAIDEFQRNVRLKHVDAAVDRCLEQASHSVKSSYTEATSSGRKNLFKEVLLACALSKKDDLASFAAVDVREPFKKIMKDTKDKYDIPNYLPTLNKLSEPSRGILMKTGKSRNYRYKFKDALLQPYVVMRGIQAGLITHLDLA